ncbi:MAG: terminase gpA endonuclease subunit [Chthoniobacteraceae bacterium]
MTAFLDAKQWLRGLIRAILKPRPRVSLVEWVNANVRVPEESGGPFPGPLRTGRFPLLEGIFDLAQRRGVHYLTLCASARVGKTLISICFALYWIAEKFGHVVWLEPSGVSAKKFVRTELEAFLRQCPPVWALAIVTRTAWTTLWKTFRGKILRLIASGAEADLHGFNAELFIGNELDRCRRSIERDAASYDKVEARTILFEDTRLILLNSTPGDGGELSPIWLKFLAGSQHWPYLPCPHCTAARARKRRKGTRKPIPVFTPPAPADCAPGWSRLSYDPDLAGWQRLTFTSQKKLVPFDARLRAFPADTPREKWREETTGRFKFDQFAIMGTRPRIDDPTQTEAVRVGWDLDAVHRGTTYECAHCKQPIEWIDLKWMLPRYRLVAHHPHAPADRISVHLWAALSPFMRWGTIAKEFLEAKGNLGALIKWTNMTCGLPFTRARTAIKEDDLDRVIARTPVRYVRGQIPMEAEELSMTVDCQGEQFWFCIRAWGILWDHPEQPAWSALVDWGEAVSWNQILELCGLLADRTGRLRRFKFGASGGERQYMVTRGLVDSGFEAETNKKVYEFCLANAEVFTPYKGGDQSKTRGNTIRLTPIMDDAIDLCWAWSDYFAADLYYSCVRDGVNGVGDAVQWWLPADLDKDYRTQLCAERQVEENQRLVWKAFGDNHLGDCEKMQRVLSGTIEEMLDEIRAERAAGAAKKEA